MTKSEIAVVTALITFIATLFVAYILTLSLRIELRDLRAEHEAIEQNYCPTCGTYLGEDER